MKKIYITLLSIMILAFPGVVNALGINESAIEIEKGNTANLEISGWEEGYTAEWDSNTPGVATVERNGKSVKVTGVAKGTTAITVVIHDADGNELDADPFKCDVTVTEPAEPEKSSDATLKSLSVKGQTLSPAFDKDKTDYTVTVSSDTTKVTVEGEKNDDKATVTGLETVTLKNDETTVNVKVKAEDGTEKTYKIVITKEKKKQVTDYTLSELKIKGAKIEPTFNKDVFEYTLILDEATAKDISKLSIDPKATDGKANPITSSYTTLSIIKKNGIKITVLDQDGKEIEGSKPYVLKLPVEEKKNVDLSKLEIVLYPFEEEFNKNVTKYTAVIPYEVDEITINATAEDKDAKVDIPADSLKNLKVGTTTITVTVKNGDEKKEYQIFVVRSKEETLDEKSTSIISNKSKNSKYSDYDIPDVESPDSVLNYITVTLASLMLFATGGIGIYFFIKTSPKRLKKEAFSKKEAKNASPLIEAKPRENKIEELSDDDKNKDA